MTRLLLSKLLSKLLNKLLIVAVLFVSTLGYLHGHELQPGMLEIKQVSTEKYEINWRAPIYYKKPHPAAVVLPRHWTVVVSKPVRKVGDSHLYSQLVAIPDGDLSDSEIRLKGLETTITEVFVRIHWLNKDKTSLLIRPDQPFFSLDVQPDLLQVAADYTRLGIEHILAGYDHLSFVLLLMLIVLIRKKLLLTITSFTLGHTMTLIGGTQGLVSLPGPPIEAIIALSIVFMASELVKINKGELSLTANYPWLVAFAFGLLHGFGFSGALQEVGLPEGDILLALVSFNLGVEIGQLLFVTVLLVIGYIIRKISPSRPSWVNNIPVYLVGSLASFWFIERMAQF